MDINSNNLIQIVYQPFSGSYKLDRFLGIDENKRWQNYLTHAKNNDSFGSCIHCLENMINDPYNFAPYRYRMFDSKCIFMFLLLILTFHSYYGDYADACLDYLFANVSNNRINQFTYLEVDLIITNFIYIFSFGKFI